MAQAASISGRRHVLTLALVAAFGLAAPFASARVERATDVSAQLGRFESPFRSGSRLRLRVVAALVTPGIGGSNPGRRDHQRRRGSGLRPIVLVSQGCGARTPAAGGDGRPCRQAQRRLRGRPDAVSASGILGLGDQSELSRAVRIHGDVSQQPIAGGGARGRARRQVFRWRVSGSGLGSQNACDLGRRDRVLRWFGKEQRPGHVACPVPTSLGSPFPWMRLPARGREGRVSLLPPTCGLSLPHLTNA